MRQRPEQNRIDFAMEFLGISAAEMEKASRVDASLINKWRRGERRPTARSTTLRVFSRALLELDVERALESHYAPYREAGNTDADALFQYFLERDEYGIALQAQASAAQRSEEYVVQHTVLLGKQGFRKAAMAMVEYTQQLPPGQTITVLCQGRYDWITKDISFVVQFIFKLRKAMQRNTRLLVINRKGFDLTETAAFAAPWLTAHLKGYIRSLYYEGSLPEEIRFIASIPGYWSARAEEDPTVEDKLYVGMYTDLRETKRDTRLCDSYTAAAQPDSQYAFFEAPLGGGQGTGPWGASPCLWEEGPLPAHEGAAAAPDGTFLLACRVPSVALMSAVEANAVAGGKNPPLPSYLFCGEGALPKGAYKLIFCREDLREGLLKERRMHEVMSALLKRRAFVPREMLKNQLRRVLLLMQEREEVEVALVPRAAFAKLQLEMVCFHNGPTVAWLQDMSESVYVSGHISGTFYGALLHTWDTLHKGWKRKSAVMRTLRKWLDGKGLDVQEEDSAMVKNWDVLPK